VLGEKLAPVSLFPPQISHVLITLDLNSGFFDKKPTTNRLNYGMAPLYPRDKAAIKMWRPLSVKTNLGYDNFLFLFVTIIKNTNELFVILEKQVS
jgi:hypothetical protein